MSKRIHIIIAEPSPIVRRGLITLLQHSSLLNCDIAEVNDITTLSSAPIHIMPNILIVNIAHMGHFSPPQLRGEIGNENLKIVALQSILANQSLLHNYDEVISIYDSEETIVDKINTLTAKDDELGGKKELTQREREIIICVVKGMTNRSIADSLCLSTHTVIAHRRNIATKLQIHSPSGLTIYAIMNKLVDLADVKNSITNK